ncbi:MAG TPA: amidohydrolase family protein [Gaiellaceae bacterium]|nr:amidohydrolase family protein [Gaiellaceae bacterium]
MRTVFTGGLVFDGTGAAPAQADVAVEDGRIAEVGAGLDGDESVDVTGTTLLPGLFDTHVHVMFNHVDVWRHLQTPFSYRFFDAIRNLQATLDAGITTVRDAGGADLGVKTAVEEGIVRGPRLQISLTMLSQTGGHGDGWLPSGGSSKLFPEYPGMPSQIVDGVDEARRKVREVIRAGADVIKIATSGGVLSPRDSPDKPGFSLEEIEVMVAEARAAGLWVMSHAQAALGIKNAVRAGVRSIDHGIYLDEEAIALMLEHGAYLVPTLVAPHGVTRAAAAGVPIPANVLAKAVEVIEAHRDSFRRAVQAGVKIAMGTDSGVTPHGENLLELELMAEGGMAPVDVLVATTRTAAELMGLERELGTIEPGKRADLVAVSGDPFEFGGLRERIERVYKDGRLVAGLAEQRERVPA